MQALFVIFRRTRNKVVAMLCAIAVFAVHKMPMSALCLYAVCAVFMAVRHAENFKRLIKGTESKFYLFGKKKK